MHDLYVQYMHGHTVEIKICLIVFMNKYDTK